MNPTFKVIFTPLEYIPTGPPSFVLRHQNLFGIYKTIDVSKFWDVQKTICISTQFVIWLQIQISTTVSDTIPIQLDSICNLINIFGLTCPA